MTVTIERRFCGPPESGNGGWVSGLLADRVPTTEAKPAVTVRLSSPPPLERPMVVGGYGAIMLLQDRGRSVATGTPAARPEGPVAAAVTVDEARDAETRYEGLRDHPFPTCFSCGTAREPGDALCLRPGPLDDGSGRYAASWTPVESSLPMVWAALDCPGGWSAGIAGRPMVLGTMTTVVDVLPEARAPHVVVAWPRGSEGRKFHSGSALFTAHGRLLAQAEATWIAVDPEQVRPR